MAVTSTSCVQRGDTPLHIAIRGRSRRLAELLLRNPKDGRLLYRPNRAGDTPYNIDCSHHKSILTQIFGARTCTASARSPWRRRGLTGVSPLSAGHLSPTETDGDMLGYDLYSSALADILSEPTMQPPTCVGLYAQWGSGKSFLLKKLEGEVASTPPHTHPYPHPPRLNSSSSSDEMKTFAGQQVPPLFQFSWLLVFLSLLLCGCVAVVMGFSVDAHLAVAVSLSLLALLYLFFGEWTAPPGPA